MMASNPPSGASKLPDTAARFTWVYKGVPWKKKASIKQMNDLKKLFVLVCFQATTPKKEEEKKDHTKKAF